VVVFAMLATAAFASFEALFAPSATMWDHWTAHDPRSTAVIDHSAWDRLLGRYVVAGGDGVNRFAYGRVTADDRAALSAYIAALAAAPVSRHGRPQQRAYWINLYNALTVRTVLDHYPVDSVRDIDTSPGVFADGPWDADAITIEGEAVTLNDIEHRILRPIWRDPRIHYAVNCASIGCPNLQTVAYTGINTDELLNTGASEYVNHPRGARVAGGELTVSSIYVWFQEDFGGTDASVIAHLRRFASPALDAQLATIRSSSNHGYDWALTAAGGGGS
jgi:hypothetical protein